MEKRKVIILSYQEVYDEMVEWYIDTVINSREFARTLILGKHNQKPILTNKNYIIEQYAELNMAEKHAINNSETGCFVVEEVLVRHPDNPEHLISVWDYKNLDATNRENFYVKIDLGV